MPDEDVDWLVPLDAIMAGRQAGGSDLFGAELVSVERGRTVYRLVPTSAVAGGADGGVHGGVLAALVDMAVVTAVLSACKQGDEMRGTAELNISYLRPAVGQELRATAQIIKKGRSLAVGDVEIHNDEGVLVAKGRATYALGRSVG